MTQYHTNWTTHHPPKPKELDKQLTNELATTFQNPDGTPKDTITNITITDNNILITRKDHDKPFTAIIETINTTILFILYNGPIIPITDLNNPNSIDHAKKELYNYSLIPPDMLTRTITNHNLPKTKRTTQCSPPN